MQSPSDANSSSVSQKIPRGFGTRGFITAFTRVHCLPQSWARPIQSSACLNPEQEQSSPPPASTLTKTNPVQRLPQSWARPIQSTACLNPDQDQSSPLPASILTKTNPVQRLPQPWARPIQSTSPSHFLRILFNVTLPSMPRSSKTLKLSVKKHKSVPPHGALFGTVKRQ